MTERIPITRPALDDEDYAAVEHVLRSGMLVQGRQVEQFEAELAERAGTPHAVVVSNCTTALHLALLGLGIGAGDLVIVTPYSWVATANVIELCGATPIFSDIDVDTMNLSPLALEATIERLRQDGNIGDVKAIMPVHTFGNTAGYDAVQGIADELGVRVIEDAACALGASIGGRPAGSIGFAGCYSFHPRKIITTGEGGALVTADEELAAFARAYRNHGQSWNGEATVVDRAGSNFRLTDFQAALGRSQLGKLDDLCMERARVAERYDQRLPALGFQPQRRSAGAVVQSYVALCPEHTTASRVVERLRSLDIEATIGTNAIPFLGFYERRYGLSESDLPATAAVSARAVTLPLFPSMTNGEQDRVIDVLATCVP